MADPEVEVSAGGDVRVDAKGNWDSTKRVSSMIAMFGGTKKAPARVIDVKVGKGGKVQMKPSVAAAGSAAGSSKAGVSGGAGVSGSAAVKLPVFKAPVALPVR